MYPFAVADGILTTARGVAALKCRLVSNPFFNDSFSDTALTRAVAEPKLPKGPKADYFAILISPCISDVPICRRHLPREFAQLSEAPVLCVWSKTPHCPQTLAVAVAALGCSSNASLPLGVAWLRLC